MKRIAAILLLAGIAMADAAPNIPPSELPGRERQRFQDSPLDRFTQPGTPDAKPLWRRDCDRSKSKRSKPRRGKPRC